MARYNVRNGFKDIFGVYLLESLSFEGDYDMPVIGCFDDILISVIILLVIAVICTSISVKTFRWE